MKYSKKNPLCLSICISVHKSHCVLDRTNVEPDLCWKHCWGAVMEDRRSEQTDYYPPFELPYSSLLIRTIVEDSCDIIRAQ